MKSGIALVAFALLTMAGWWTKTDWLVQWHPSWVPTQFNTALGFLFLGVGLLGKPRTAGIAAISLGALTLMEYAGAGINIDNVFSEPFITTNTSHPGRPAPNTAIGFLMAGSAIAYPRTRQPATVLLLAMSLTGIFGYIVGLDHAYGWGTLTDMALQTAAGFALFSASMWRRQTHGAVAFASLYTTTSVGIALTVYSQTGMPRLTLAWLLVGLAFSLVAALAIHLHKQSATAARELSVKNTQLVAATEVAERARKVLEAQIIMDPLTKLLNLRGLDRQLPAIMSHADRSDEKPYALMIDLDNFKIINDVFGFSSGSVVLKESADRIKRSLRHHDELGRLGGDEFLALFCAHDYDDAKQIAQRVRRTVEQHRLTNNKENLSVTCSIALVPIGPEYDSIDAIVKLATKALHTSKRSGKNRVTTLSEAPNSVASNRGQFIDENNYRFVAQPIVDLRTLKPIGHEYLTRFQLSPYKNPEALFAAAFECQVLQRVDLICARGCIARAARDGAYDVHVNMHLSTLISLDDEKMRELFAPVRARRLCIELNEGQVIGTPSASLEAVSRARSLGAIVSLDDVGAGETSVDALCVINPEVVKIDKHRIRGCNRLPERSDVLRRFLLSSRANGARVIAEGVETEAELETLRLLGFRYGQGYLFGKPA